MRAISHQLFTRADNRRGSWSMLLTRLIPILDLWLVLRNSAFENLLFAMSLKPGNHCIPACLSSSCFYCTPVMGVTAVPTLCAALQGLVSPEKEKPSRMPVHPQRPRFTAWHADTRGHTLCCTVRGGTRVPPHRSGSVGNSPLGAAGQ